MCGSTTAEHTCRCCIGEGRRARERRRYARAAGGSVRPYRRAAAPASARPGVVAEDGWTVVLPRDPRHLQAALGIEALPADVRDTKGRVIWMRVPAHQRWMRSFEDAPMPAPMRLPVGLVTADGVIDEERLATYDARRQAILRDLVTQSFQPEEKAA